MVQIGVPKFLQDFFINEVKIAITSRHMYTGHEDIRQWKTGFQ